ncbi:DUF4129 domain-containing protein [Microbacterium gilvum]|uniref:Protein-glutamine gamma-glutamyltransferase-like C-terminal domain-containing protein n=1 Tax=Microbacterium gilvum TaxID=1336204 RepID=A0ABP8ZXM4_9MICO
MRAALGVALAFLPDGDDARDWAEDELSDPVYDAAQPNLVDRIAQAIADFVSGILNPQIDGGWSPLLATVVIAVVALLVVAAFLIWGRPRSAGRAASASALLFGDDAHRSAAELRADAARHAAASAWDAAIADAFRALARGLEERDLVDPAPGMTAQRFADLAVEPFPGHTAALHDAAASFDDVRYLRRPGARDTFDRIAALDAALGATRPAVLRAEVRI